MKILRAIPSFMCLISFSLLIYHRPFEAAFFCLMGYAIGFGVMGSDITNHFFPDLVSKKASEKIFHPVYRDARGRFRAQVKQHDLDVSGKDLEARLGGDYTDCDIETIPNHSTHNRANSEDGFIVLPRNASGPWQTQHEKMTKKTEEIEYAKRHPGLFRDL